MPSLRQLFKKKLTLLTLALLAAAIPLTVYISQQQQRTRQEADVAPIALRLTPQTSNIGLTGTTDVKVILAAGSAQINAVDIRLSFTPGTLEVVSFQPSPAFPPVLNNPPNNTTGSFRYIGTNASTAQTGTITIGTLKVRGKAVGSGTITFGNTLITSPAQSQGVTTTKTNGTYTVTINPTPTIGGGDSVDIYFSQPGRPNDGTKMSQLTAPQGPLSLELFLNTRPFNVNAFDIKINYGNFLTLNSVTDGADTSKFPSEVFKTINNTTRSLRYSRVSTNTSAINTGRLHIGTLNFSAARGTGTISFGTAVITSPSQSGSLTIDYTPLSYNILEGITITPTPGNGSPTPTRTPTPPGGTLTPTPSGGMQLLLNVGLTGIGVDGGNTSPRRPQRQVTVTVTDRQNKDTQASGFINFDKTSGLFKGTVSLPSSLAQGPYTIRIKSNQFLKKIVPGIHNLASGGYTVPLTVLVVGDINEDNKVNIIDYNSIFSCFSKKANGSSCTNKPVADLNDDDKVDGIDYNLFVRSLSVKEGD